MPDARKGTALMAGAHLSVGAGEESAERARPEGKKENGPAGRGVLGCGRKKEEGEGKERRWAGLKARKKRKREKKGRRKLLTGEEGNRRSRGRRHGVDGEKATTHEKEDTTTKRTTS